MKLTAVVTSVLSLAFLAAPALAQDAPATPAAASAEASGAPGDASGEYRFEPSHSHIVFSYDHVGFSHSSGLIRGVEGKIVLNQADPAKSSVEASFPLANILTVSPDLDRDLMGPDWLNSKDGAGLVTFKSTSVTIDDDDDDEADVEGDLTLNGITKPVVLEVELEKLADHPITGKPAAGFSAETTIKRSDFGLGKMVPAVSDEIEVDIHVEASKAN